MTSYVYQQSEPGLWTVGFYDPAGGWHPESDHDSRESAALRVERLNGGSGRWALAGAVDARAELDAGRPVDSVTARERSRARAQNGDGDTAAYWLGYALELEQIERYE